MSDLIHNERIKLLANLLNAIAGSSFTIGVAAPIASVFFYNPAGLRVSVVVIGAAVWAMVAVSLHLVAEHTLGRLRP